MRYSRQAASCPGVELGAASGMSARIAERVCPSPSILTHLFGPKLVSLVKCSASIDTCLSPSANPTRDARVTSLGFRELTSTVTTLPAPASVMFEVVTPLGALSHWMPTHTRSCLCTVPDELETMTQGSLVVMVKLNAVRPRLNTSMKYRCCVSELNAGRTAGMVASGHALSDPSIATPIPASTGTEMFSRAIALMVLLGGAWNEVYLGRSVQVLVFNLSFRLGLGLE